MYGRPVPSQPIFSSILLISYPSIWGCPGKRSEKLRQYDSLLVHRSASSPLSFLQLFLKLGQRTHNNLARELSG